MRSGADPAVIPLEERAAYMKYLADSDYEGLSEMFRRLSNAEEERMRRFDVSAGHS